MSVDQAFLRSIIEAPDDDAPRLVYADWLDEHGEPERAEFIRVQCSLPRTPADDPGRPSLERREQELLGQYGWAWAEFLGWQVSQWAYRRGFIEAVEMGLERSRDEILDILNKAPIRYVRDASQFCDLKGVVDALPDLERLHGLEFWGLYAFDNSLLEEILQSPHLANLRVLILHHDRNGNLADEDVLVRAMHSPHRTNLRELAVNVDGSWRGPSRKILAAMAESASLRNLHKLNLDSAGDQGNRPEMNVKTIRALGASPNLAGLEQLDMGRTTFSLGAWDEVLKWPWLSGLKWLRLHYARQVNPPDLLTVAEIRNLPKYRQAFEQLVGNIDWDTAFVTPWDDNASWRGLSWDGLRQQHLFSMWPYVQHRDYDELESVFRADCVKHAGIAAAEAIDALPFPRYQAQLAAGLTQAIDSSSRHTEATAIHLRLRTDLQWNGEYHVSREEVVEPFEPHSEYSYGMRLERLDAGSFPEAGEVRQRFLNHGPLDPGGAGHYLLARTVAAFGRCLEQFESPVPVFFSCISAVFRMS